MAQYRHILFATDLLDGCLEIGQRAVDAAGLYGARVSLLHVLESIPVGLDDGIVPFNPAMTDEVLAGEAARSLERLAAQLGIAQAPRWVRSGPTRTEIVSVCRDELVDLLVIGNRSRHGLSLLFGSTSQSLVGDAPCDVLVVRIEH